MHGESDIADDKLIDAIVFGKDATDVQIKMFELAENFHRTELTPEERTAHMLKYAALLKKTGAVRSRREKQAKTQTKEGPNVSTGNISVETEKPTTTEAVSKEMGINRHTVHKRTKKAIETAKAQGVDVDDESDTLETMSAEKLGEVADAVSKAAPPEAEPTPEETPLEKTTKTRDAAHRKDLTDEVAAEVAAALNPIWQKWCDADPDVDWQMFAAAIRRFIKSGAI